MCLVVQMICYTILGVRRSLAAGSSRIIAAGMETLAGVTFSEEEEEEWIEYQDHQKKWLKKMSRKVS